MDKVDYTQTSEKGVDLIDAEYQNFAFQRHYHLDFHIGLITKGEQKFTHQGSSLSAGHGQMVVMPPDELHDGQSVLKQGYQVKVFSIDPTWLSNLANSEASSSIINFNQTVVSNPDLFRRLYQTHTLLGQQSPKHTPSSTKPESLSSSPISQLAQDCLLYEGFEQLFEQYGNYVQPRTIPLGNKSIEILKEYLMANLDQPIQLETLANLCQLSSTQFQRHFKAKMGITPYAWLSRLRLEQAMKLLKSGISSTEVAHRVGFYDQAHFTKAFKVTYGVTPSQISECR